jgi:hypothetical protein
MRAMRAHVVMKALHFCCAPEQSQKNLCQLAPPKPDIDWGVTASIAKALALAFDVFLDGPSWNE